MVPSFRPLVYTWGAIFAGFAAGAGALQIIGPPERPSQAATSAPATAPANPPDPDTPVIASAPSALEPAPQPPVLPSTSEAAAVPALPPVASPQATSALPERGVRREPAIADVPANSPRKNGLERRRSVASIAPKPLSQENVWPRTPRFIGVFVTQADGTRIFKPQP